MISDWSLEYRKWELSHYTTEELVEEVNRRTEQQLRRVELGLDQIDSIIIDMNKGFNQIDEQIDITDYRDDGSQG